MPPPPPTPRLEFRRWRENDGQLAISLWCDGDVMRHMGGVLTATGARERLAGEIVRGARTGLEYWPMFLRRTGTFAGCAGLRPWGEALERTDLLEAGVHVMRAGWGQRLGEEALQAVLAYGFDTLQLQTIVAGHGVTNANSQALIGRLGFHHTHDGVWAERNLNVRWYALDVAEWRAARGHSPSTRP